MKRHVWKFAWWGLWLWEATLTYVGMLARLDQRTGTQMPKARLAQASELEQTNQAREQRAPLWGQP
jgi:hypothetical protein